MEARSRSPRGARPRYGRCPCLVNEDELVRIEANLAPFFSPLQDVRPLLLGGVCGLFLSVILRRWKKRDNAEMLNVCPSAASAAFSSSNVLSGSTAISARFDRLRASIAALWFRCHLVGLARLCYPPDRARHAHSKVRCGLSRGHAARDGSNHTLAEINRKRWHHACRPPSPASSLNQNRRDLGIPNDSIRPGTALGDRLRPEAISILNVKLASLAVYDELAWCRPTRTWGSSIVTSMPGQSPFDLLVLREKGRSSAIDPEAGKG